jgi:hypothetical protein
MPQPPPSSPVAIQCLLAKPLISPPMITIMCTIEGLHSPFRVSTPPHYDTDDLKRIIYDDQFECPSHVDLTLTKVCNMVIAM